jgi:hypothetical protein
VVKGGGPGAVVMTGHNESSISTSDCGQEAFVAGKKGTTTRLKGRRCKSITENLIRYYGYSWMCTASVKSDVYKVQNFKYMLRSGWVIREGAQTKNTARSRLIY